MSKGIETDYLSQSLFSDPGSFSEAFNALPNDIEALCQIVQGLLIHDYVAFHHYGPVPTGFENKVSRSTLSVAERVQRILASDESPLTQPRPPFDREIGTCRDFALLLMSMARQKGIPARVRCGFASYFEAPWADHWITEIWDDGENKWRRVDPQLDELHVKAYDINFDVCDLKNSHFLTAPEAWQSVQSGRANVADFRAGEYSGDWLLSMNVARDCLVLADQFTSPLDAWRDFRHEPLARDAVEITNQAPALSLRNAETPPDL